MTDQSDNKEEVKEEIEEEDTSKSESIDVEHEGDEDQPKNEEGESEENLKESLNEVEQKLESREKEIDELKEQRKKLKKGIAKRNKMIEQHKQKAERNKENTEREMVEEFAADIGQIRQSIMLALENAEDDCNVKSGLNATVDKMDSILSEYDIRVLEPDRGNKFNPDLHEAIGTEETSELEDGLVVETYKQGFAHNGTVIEPAKVVISE